MLRNVLIASPLLLLLSILSSRINGEYIGDKCIIENRNATSTAGICKLLGDCPVVFQALLRGKLPDKTCSYVGTDPIVCCPTNTNLSKPVFQPGPKPSVLINGTVARAKCAENAQAVYGLRIPPISIFNRAPINVSLCSIGSRRLITGGKKANPREFPHMAILGYNDEEGNLLWRCGGTLISSRIVLTAAHCTTTLDWGDPKLVRVGDLNLQRTNDDAAPENVGIEKIIIHPEYKRPAQYHDIAILRLEKEVTYNEWVRPACLPVDWPDTDLYHHAIATGWGLVDWCKLLADEKGSDDLLKVTLNLVSHESCNANYRNENIKLPKGIINDWQICAGETGKDTCQGDSGGPLTTYNTKYYCVYNIVGITSLGRYCGSSAPGVYTRVYQYIPWIEKTAWPEEFV